MHYLVVIGLLSLLAVMLWLYLLATKSLRYWKDLGIPFVKAYPLVGNIARVMVLRQSLAECLFDIHSSAKTAYVGLFMFNKPVLLVRDPLLIKHVLIKDFDYFEDRTVTQSKHDRIGSNLLFSLKNPTWRTLRAKLTPVFSSGKMKQMLPLLIEVSKELRYYIDSVAIRSEYTETKDMCMRYTADAISSCFYGIDGRSFRRKDAEFYVAARRAMDWSILTSISMSAYFVAPFLVDLFRLKFINATTADFMEGVFSRHMNERKRSQSYRGDLIDILIRLQSSEGDNVLTDVVLVSQAIQFVLAGFETSASTLTFALYLLAKHRNYQNRLRTEIRTVLKKHNNPTYQDLKDLKYMDAVISETLRMYPILAYIDRKCSKPYTIPGTSTVLPKGTAVYISLLGLHLDPQSFPNPRTYDPGRFLAGNGTNSDAIYAPFGDGPRNCIGSRFAWIMMKTALTQILSEFEVETCKETQDPLTIDPKGVLISPVNGRLNLRFKKCAHVN